MVTWRTVTAPNQSGANNLAARGIDTILQSSNNLSNRLQAPKKAEEERKKEAFRQALQLTGVDQNQQRIDNTAEQNAISNDLRQQGLDAQADQFEQREAAKLAAADILFNRQNQRDEANRQFTREQADANRAASLQASIAKAQAKSTDKSGKRDLRKFTDQFIADNESSIDDDTKRALTGLESHLRGKDLPQSLKESIIGYSFQTGLINDSERLVESLGGKTSPAAFDKFINEYLVNNPTGAGALAPGSGARTPAQEQAAAIINASRANRQ